MNPAIIKLAVVLIPFIILFCSLLIFRLFSARNSRYPLAAYRLRRGILRALASGVLLR